MTRAIPDDWAADLELIRGALIRERGEKGATLRDLGDQIGMSPQAVLDIINGDSAPYANSMAKLRRWARERAAKGTLDVGRPPTGVAFPTFPYLRLPADYGQTLLRSAELEALRHYAREGDEENPSPASLAAALGAQPGEMLGFIGGSPPSAPMEAALRRFVPFAVLQPPPYGPLALASFVDAVLADGAPAEHAGAIRLVILFAVQEFFRQQEIDGPDWFASTVSWYRAAGAQQHDGAAPEALVTATTPAQPVIVHDGPVAGTAPP